MSGRARSNFSSSELVLKQTSGFRKAQIQNFSNVVFDLADRDTKSERFNKMKPGDRVVITNNQRSGHHDVTGKRRHLVNKHATVMMTAVWPNTWLTVRIEETNEVVKVRTSNIIMLDDIKDHKFLIDLQAEQQAQLDIQEVKLADEQIDMPSQEEMVEAEPTPYSIRRRESSTRTRRHYTFDNDPELDESPIDAPIPHIDDVRPHSGVPQKRKGPQPSDPRDVTKKTKFTDGFSCTASKCQFW